MRWSVLAVAVLAGAPLFAQESALEADFRRESEHLKESCGMFSIKSIGGCAIELATDHPLHIALGSIAPQNGFGVGGAFVAHYTPNENWRLSWDVDAIGSVNGAWRAGGYMKIIHTPVVDITVRPAGGAKKKPRLAVHEYTMFNVYAQTTSLNKIYFFGEGTNTAEAGRSVFGMQETIIGGSVVKPVTALGALNLSLLGEFNGRLADVRGNHGESAPSIEQLYTEASAPGLMRQPGFAQFGEGVRLQPELWKGRVQLHYLLNFQQFVAVSDAHYSFRRWGIDLDHEFPLYGKTTSFAPRETDGPDECADTSGSDQPCRTVSRNRNGSVGFRVMLTESVASGGSVVPFYFQPTLGGSDINGNPALSSYVDYRFRAPNVLLFRESFEHSLYKGWLGFTFLADQGKVAQSRGDVDLSGIRYSFSPGLTLRAGGFPQVYLLFAFGGSEGNHTIASINNSLLGGSYRPSLN